MVFYFKQILIPNFILAKGFLLSLAAFERQKIPGNSVVFVKAK